MPGGGATVFTPRSGFVAGEAVRWPLRVVYVDHSHFEHHGAAAGDVAIVLLKTFEQACRGFWCSPRGLGGVLALVQGL